MSFEQYTSVARHVTPIRVDDSLFCVPMYSATSKGLKVRLGEWCVVERRVLQASDGPRVVYMCSCSEMRAVREQMPSMHHYTKDEMPISLCYHARLVLETTVWASPEMVIDDVVKLHASTYLLRAEETIVLKKNRRRTLTCSTCKRVAHGCPHMRRLETVAIDHPELDVLMPEPVVPTQGRGVPQDAIDQVQQKIDLAPKPRGEKRCPNRSGKVARVYDIDGYTEYTYGKDETLSRLREVSCDTVFRYSREVWFTHRLIHVYLDNMANGNASFDAFYKTQVLQYARRGQQFCSKPTARTVIQAAFHHLDLDVDAALQCEACREVPLRHRVFILDGTSNGFLNATKTPRHQEPCSSGPKELPGSTYALVKSTQDRARVLKPFESLDDFQRDAYLKQCERVDVGGLIPFMTHALTHCRVEDVAVFLRDIASPYPITATVQAAMVMPDGGLLQRCFEEDISKDDRDAMRQMWPSLWTILAPFRRIPGSWWMLLTTIRNLAVSIYRTQPIEYTMWETTTEEHPHVCFPEFPRRRRQPWPRKASTYEASCTKHILQHRHFSPGLFLICCPHGKILGFCAMQEYESVHTAFELIVERFDEPPGMIIYDNGCNLYRYGMMRCPGIFGRIRIMIDRFHSPGHVLCPPSFTFQYYPDDVRAMLDRMTYRELNTQAVEQTNGRLRKFEQSLGFMNQENYIVFVRVLASLLNLYS
jgi:hypothetical protein